MSSSVSVCTLDFETRSELDVRDVGAWRYAEHLSTKILCLRWRIDHGENKLWTPDLPFPQELIDHVNIGGIFEAHNAQFERAIWIKLLYPLGIPVPRYWKDTLAACAYRGLPLALDEVGDILNLSIQKDKRGKFLIQKLCQPRKPTKAELKIWEVNHPGEEMPVQWNEDPELLKELYQYCGTDVDTETALGDMVGDLPSTEQRLWVLDQVINQRGVQVDLEAVHAALKVVSDIEKILEKELFKLTNGEVTTGGQVARILKWINDNGFEVHNLQKDTLEDILSEVDMLGEKFILDPKIKRVLQIRQYLSRASTKKLSKILEFVCDDGRCRGMLQYHAAGTGRWAGRGPQPHNFPRGDKDILKSGIETIISSIKCIDTDLLTLLYGNPMEAVATSLRGMFISAPDKKLRVADFSAIEARIVMWMANQEDALEAFRKYDRKEGPAIYCLMAEQLYKRPIDKNKDPKEYLLGKITILGAGYQMGPAKLRIQAWKDYKVRLDEVTSEFLIQGYRSTNSNVKYMWYGVEDAAITAVLNPGKIVSYSKIAYQTVDDAAGRWLTCILPNGRRIWYHRPEVQEVHVTYKDGTTRLKKQLWYWGRDNKKGGVWAAITTYGGMLVENFTQAIARDLMAEAMLRVEKAGYSVILTVHDEIVSETAPEFGSLKDFTNLITIVPEWAERLPISAESWEGNRYKKA